MRKNKIKSIFIFLMLFLVLILGLSNNSVLAVEVEESLDDGWENYGTGISNGEIGLIDFNLTFVGAGSAFQTNGNNPANGSNSFYMRAGFSASSTELGRWNLTQDFNYISEFNFWCYWLEDTEKESLELEFCNDDNVLFEFQFNHAGKIFIDGITYDFTSIELEPHANFTDHFYHFSISHNYSNQMIFKVCNSSGALWETGDCELKVSDDWETFNKITFNSVIIPSGDAGDTTVWFDDFNITTDEPPVDPDSYCTASYTYSTSDYGAPTIKDLDVTTIDFSLDSFNEDVTIKCIEINVGSDQVNTISNDVADYLLYINGDSCGNPYSIGTKRLNWYGLDIDIGSDDLVIELVCGAGVYFGDTILYWNDLELDQDGNAYYSEYNATEIGNGEIDGTPMFSYMDRGLDCDIAYDIGSSVTVCNDISLTMLSDDELTAYEYFRMNIEIIGSDLTEITIINNDTGLDKGTSHLSGNQNTVWKWLILPQNVETGNYSIRVAEIGCTDYEWLEFYINLTGYTSSDWDLSVSDSSPPVGVPFDIDIKVPLGETANLSVAVGYEVFPTVFLGTYLGTGDWDNSVTSYTTSQKCTIFLINASNGVVMKTLVVNPSGTSANLIYTNEDRYFIGDTAYIDGVYSNVDSYCYLQVISPNGVHYGTPCYQGVIDYEIVVDELGTWTYQILQDGVSQSWSVSSFLVVDSGIGGGTWYGLPFYVPLIIGIFITLIVTISPLLLATYITKNTRIERVTIPSLVYVGFFFFGLVISVLMDFLPSYLPFVILFGMIIFFAVQWLYGKKGEVAGE